MIPVSPCPWVLARFKEIKTRPDIRSATPVSATARRTCSDPAAHYDELTTREAALNEIRLGRAAVLLREILVKVAAPQPLPRLASIEPAQLINAIKDNFTVSIADNAYWWLVVYGVFRFFDIKNWFSGDHWTGLGRQRCHDRTGLALLQKLAIAATTP